jgi:hypothetical protein
MGRSKYGSEKVDINQGICNVEWAKSQSPGGYGSEALSCATVKPDFIGRCPSDQISSLLTVSLPPQRTDISSQVSKTSEELKSPMGLTFGEIVIVFTKEKCLFWDSG